MPIASFFKSAMHRFWPVFALLAPATIFAQSPSAADGFDPNVDGNVYALATQADGKVLVGGQFSFFQTSAAVRFGRSNLARLNAEGSLDESFNTSANAPVRALLIQPDGKILIGGDFTTLQPLGAAVATPRNRLARLNADGTVDATFNPNLGGALQPQVFALMLQPDGRIIVGGSFTTVQPNGAATATTRNYIARLNADGTLDQGFNPNPNGMVLALAQHVDGKILVGGGFTSFTANGETTPTGRNRIARLNPSGTVDSEFSPNANNGVTGLAVQRDGKIVLVGHFTTLQPPADETVSNRNRIARLNLDGTLDSEFFPRTDGSVLAVTLQADGAILIGGSFGTVWGRGAASSSRGNVARFLPDGSLDAAFNPGFNSTVDAFAFQPDGKLVVGGYFTRAQPPGATTAIIRNRLARLNPDGSLDSNFELADGGRTLASVVQADGKVVIGGSFTSVGGATHNYLARLNADGSVDAAYKPDLNGRVLAMAIQPDGKVLIGGTFTAIGGESRNYFARLNPSGTIDSEFYPNVDGQVAAIVLQTDGSMLIGGTFSHVQPIGATTTTTRTNVAKITSTGQVDTVFDPGANSTVAAIAVQSDGKILLGGAFTSFTPKAGTDTYGRSHLARVNADGTIDTTYSPSLNAQVNAIAIQPDGKAVIAGTFTGIFPVGATEQTTRNRLARLNADGSIDTAFNPNANNSVVAMALQSDGKIVIGGPFTTLQPNGASDWTLRKYAARLNADGTVDATFNLDLNEQAGNRVDSIRMMSDGRMLVGGNFTSLQPIGSAARVARRYLARINANGTLDPLFDAGTGGAAGGLINAFAVQADAKVIAAGSFADLGGARSTNIARFNSEGTPDAGFNAVLAADGPINAVVVRPGNPTVASQIAGFAWLNRDGSLRPGFNVSSDARIAGQINAVVVQSDGSVILGGAFTNLTNSTGGNLVRFSRTGVLDPNFNPRPSGAVTGLVQDSSGRLIVIGSFSLIGDTIRNRIARLNSNGSIDAGFDPSASAIINAVVIQSDGKIVVGGAFTTFSPNGATTTTARNYLARINTDGTVDADYNPGPNSVVNALAIQSDGKVIAGGSFTTVQPTVGTTLAATATTRNYIARLNLDGSLDQNFDPNANGPVSALVAQANGQIILGGSFTTLQPFGGTTVLTRNNIARVNSDGALDPVFNPNANAAVTSIELQPDGAVLLGGSFTTLQANGASAAVARNRLARVGADGSLDVTFNPNVNGTVASVVARPDGTLFVTGSFTGLESNGAIMVGGSFATIGGISARNLAILNDEGSVGAGFLPQPDGAVNALLALPDGRTIAGGAFTNIAGVARNRMARFSVDGVLETAFNPNVSGPVSALALQGDGRILVGGTFANIGGQPRGNLARLNADGTLDTTFIPAVAGAVTALAVQADGRILAITAGSGVRSILMRLNANGTADPTFAAVNSGSDLISSLALQTDGRIIVGGSFTTIGGAPIARLARLNSDGSIDRTFSPAPNGAVAALALQPDGRLMIGGTFTNVGGVVRVGLARLTSTGLATQTLGVMADRRTAIWNRAGTGGELSAAVFEQSSDRSTWTRLGFGTRVGSSGNWQLTGLSLPASGVFYLRARGLAPSSAGTSSGLYETVREITFTSPVSGISAALDEPVVRPASAGQTVAAAGFVFDGFTGIAPRSALTVIPGEGTVEIMVASPIQNNGASPAKLANLSTRGRVTADSPLLLGFAISGSEPRRVLVRAIGPTLGLFGVSDALAATRLRLYDAAGRVIAENEGWGGAADVGLAFARTGAFPLAVGSADSAALVTLVPGNYTMEAVDARGTGGVALAEIYDADTGAGSRLVNVSGRGAAGAGGAALISGFVLSGDAPSRVLLRGVGPGLARFGAAGVLADPALVLFSSDGRELGSNDNWVSSVPQISSAAAGAGAFALEPGSKDAAVLATLPPGAYTIQVKAGTSATGAALLEIYEVRN